MNDVTKIQEQHTAGPQVIGFDYQFYYFMLLALELKYGQKIGFEVKDDVHIDKEDGTTILFQTKHTVLKKADGGAENLTTLDSDLWKTLSNWTDMIKSSETILATHSFCLVTNKSESNNKFIDVLILSSKNKNIDNVIETIKELRQKTTDKDLKLYIKNVLSLGKIKSKLFYSKLSIVTNSDDIIGNVKRKIYENIRNTDLIDSVFDTLSSNLHAAKYMDIKDRKKFEISFTEFNSRFGKCFRVAFKDKPLPKRQFSFILPDKLEKQIFIKQLLDVGELDENSPKIIDYTTQMLQMVNHLSYWAENNFVLPTEMEEFNRNSIILWENEFRAKYRQIEKRINSGILIEDIELEIQGLAIELIDFMRRKDLSLVDNTLGIELSNGHYYALSEKPEIGWHFGWKQKYKKV